MPGTAAALLYLALAGVSVRALYADTLFRRGRLRNALGRRGRRLFCPEPQMDQQFRRFALCRGHLRLLPVHAQFCRLSSRRRIARGLAPVVVLPGDLLPRPPGQDRRSGRRQRPAGRPSVCGRRGLFPPQCRGGGVLHARPGSHRLATGRRPGHAPLGGRSLFAERLSCRFARLRPGHDDVCHRPPHERPDHRRRRRLALPGRTRSSPCPRSSGWPSPCSMPPS